MSEGKLFNASIDLINTTNGTMNIHETLQWYDKKVSSLNKEILELKNDNKKLLKSLKSANNIIKMCLDYMEDDSNGDAESLKIYEIILGYMSKAENHDV